MIASQVDRLVEENMGLVAMVARRYVGRGTDYEDLIQIGAVGLVKAAKRFDESRNLKFSTYAVSKIVGELKTYFRDNGSVKISRSLKERLFKVRKTQEKLLILLGREPSISEIAQELSLSVEEVIECVEIKETTLSLDKESEEGGCLFDLIGEGTEDRNLLRITLHQALEKLDSRERQIIVMRYFLDRTQLEIANLLEITQVSVSRQEKNILKKLAKMIS